MEFLYGWYLLSKNSKHGLPSFKEVLQKVSNFLKDQEKIVNQKNLIIKSLDLKNSVLNQDLEPILEISLSNLDPIKEAIKVRKISNF